ncbi:MAG: hypothetical protein O3C19_06755 [Bacteroidetes bacterium]|nr:hypothetical protein [Bacteroidota bacterium]
MSETINGHYQKIDNLDDAFKAVVDKFSEMAEKDSSLQSADDELEVNGVKYLVEVKVVKE